MIAVKMVFAKNGAEVVNGKINVLAKISRNLRDGANKQNLCTMALRTATQTTYTLYT